jgi:hypothetical protein
MDETPAKKGDRPKSKTPVKEKEPAAKKKPNKKSTEDE